VVVFTAERAGHERRLLAHLDLDWFRPVVAQPVVIDDRLVVDVEEVEKHCHGESGAVSAAAAVE